MDVLAHGLWTNVMYKAIPSTRNSGKIILWGILFGMLPDIVSFTPVILVRLYNIIFANAPATFLTNVFHTYKFSDYAIISYSYTHSILIWLLVVLLIWAMIKKFPWILLGWGLHVAIDIFSHTTDFFAVPFLFPISDFQISAISWAHPGFMIVNYFLLLFVYLILLPRLKHS